MGEFYRLLIKGYIPYPTQRKFTLSNWENSFTSLTEVDKDDQRIFSAGKWVFNKLEFIRKQISDIDFSSLKKEEMIQSLFGFVNRDSMILAEMQNNQTPESGILNVGYYNKKIKFNEIGPELSIVDKFESTVEAIKYPLLQTFNSNNFSTKKSKSLENSKLLNFFQKIINYGQYYLIVESIWGDCLWKGFSIEFNEKYDLVKSPIDRNAILQAVAQFRLDSLTMESTTQAIKMWKNDLAEEIKKLLIDINVIRAIKGSGKSKKYVMGKYKYEEDFPPSSFITELKAHELYFNKLLDQSLPILPEISLRELFKVWHLLFSLADILKERLPQDTGVVKVSKLKLFATQIKKVDLVKLISKSINVGYNTSEKIIRLISYSGKNVDELWTTPFYEYNERLYFAYGTLLYPNLLRSLENWIRCSGLDLSERGSLFEEYVREEIASSISKSKLVKNAGVFQSAIKISSADKSEEIDLVFWIGNKFIIGELKCILFPTSPLEDYRYQNRLEEAATQIRRKKDVIEKNKKEFLKKISLEKCFDESKITISPIIITNLMFGSGKRIEGVPVTDLLLLNKYLRDGEMQLFVERSINAEDKVYKTYKFYNNEQEAIDKFDGFISNPPLLILYSNFIKKNIHKYPAGNDTDRPFTKELLEVVVE